MPGRAHHAFGRFRFRAGKRTGIPRSQSGKVHSQDRPATATALATPAASRVGYKKAVAGEKAEDEDRMERQGQEPSL
ncbi:hypothetical protein DesfrDRAFT_2291 [Solidesulfovibrio fructosivorans JJ]]|uniref:Uncharacterized protein n=1 Tax=Solidesulfovibrio fructosivorans JJ] TaxID=596151 RepID=E1JXE2_SOLFR|nr:hypothetical protein [Solidesulfovibrio fructosivorans]EFL50919.1 hypothetical protein DesfrDRAFT_2291 [Solidesulfovibrio fructosivorans JJ]]